MYIEKLKTLMGIKKVRTPTQEEMLRLQVGAKMEAEAALMQGLMRSPAWKIFDEYFQAQYEVLGQELTICKPEELKELQLKRRLIDELYKFMHSKIAIGS